ncbi:MAG: phosphopantetheine-binding protein [Gemmatimonadaceae bacterium]
MDSELQQSIRTKIIQLGQARGLKIANLDNDVLLLEAGLLDSASVLEMIVWLETKLDIEIDLGALTIENFGSVNRMVEFLAAMQRAS